MWSSLERRCNLESLKEPWILFWRERKYNSSHRRRPKTGTSQTSFHWIFWKNWKLEKRGKYIKNYKKFWEELIAYFPWYDTRHIENDASNNSFVVACAFVTAVTFLRSRCLATIGRILPNRAVT
jgi:hypothetical protein